MQLQRGRKLSKKERRVRRQAGGEGTNPTNDRFNFNLKQVTPLTDNQYNTFESYRSDNHLLLIGSPGTGKTFLSAYLGMNDIMEHKLYDKMVIVRSIVPLRDIGALPGSSEEKSKVYEAPYYSIFKELFGRSDAYEYFKSKKIIEFYNTSYLRGITLNNAIVIVDEFQSMTWHELYSIFTRLGENSKIIFIGDTKQNDLHSKRGTEVSGYKNLVHVIDHMSGFEIITFTSSDVVRGKLVKSFIMTCEKLGY
jgi:phosphate starvation-inducible PhoH-like protein